MKDSIKITLFCILSIYLNIANGQTSVEINNEFKKSNCKTPDFNIVAKLKENTYEVTFVNGFTGSSLYPNWNHDTAILTTKSYQWSSPGKVVNYENPIVVRVDRKIKIKLTNGFDKEVPHWVESEHCKDLRAQYIKVMSEEIKNAKQAEDEKKKTTLNAQKKDQLRDKNEEKRLKKEKKEKINALFE